ncbi:hypothetical protein GCM10020001_000230 [Nonomuraea salmonea]
MLLNTSFNNNAEPIVQTVQDAVTCFLTTELDYLVIEDFLIRRRWGHWLGLDGLVPRHRPVTRLVKRVRTTPAGHRDVVHEIFLDYTNGPRAEISPAAFAVLEAADGKRTLESLAGDAGVSDDLRKELHLLWQGRFFVLAPPPAVRAGCWRGAPPAWCGLGDHLGDGLAALRRVDDLVHHAEPHGRVETAGLLLVLGGQGRLEQRALLLRRGGQGLAVQDAHRRDRAHDRHPRRRPGEDPGGAQGAGVHRDVRPAVRLAHHQRHPGDAGLGEGVQQFRAPPDDAVPLLLDAGQVAGDVHHDHQRHPEGVAHPHEPGGLLG